MHSASSCRGLCGRAHHLFVACGFVLHVPQGSWIPWWQPIAQVVYQTGCCCCWFWCLLGGSCWLWCLGIIGQWVFGYWSGSFQILLVIFGNRSFCLDIVQGFPGYWSGAFWISIIFFGYWPGACQILIRFFWISIRSSLDDDHLLGGILNVFFCMLIKAFWILIEGSWDIDRGFLGYWSGACWILVRFLVDSGQGIFGYWSVFLDIDQGLLRYWSWAFWILKVMSRWSSYVRSTKTPWSDLDDHQPALFRHAKQWNTQQPHFRSGLLHFPFFLYSILAHLCPLLPLVASCIAFVSVHLAVGLAVAPPAPPGVSHFSCTPLWESLSGVPAVSWKSTLCTGHFSQIHVLDQCLGSSQFMLVVMSDLSWFMLI